jgi:hypothetical protein
LLQHIQNRFLVPIDALEVVFLLDGSKSEGFNELKKFVKKTIASYDVSPQGTHIAVVEFSDQATVEIPLTESFNPEKLKELVDTIKPSNGDQRNVDLALDVTKVDVLSPKGGARVGVPRAVILVTTGKSTGRIAVEDAAEPLKKDGVKIYVVGVGDSVDPDELVGVVGNATDIHPVDNPEDTSTVVNKVVDSVKKDNEKGTNVTIFSVLPSVHLAETFYVLSCQQPLTLPCLLH